MNTMSIVWLIPKKENGPVSSVNRHFTDGRVCIACGEQFKFGQTWTVIKENPDDLSGPSNFTYLHWRCFKRGFRTIDGG